MTGYKWEVTTDIHQLLIELKAVKLSLDTLHISPRVEESLRKTALLKSAVFSVRIEGFPDTETSPKLESQNLVRAYNQVYYPNTPQSLNISYIKKLHKTTLNNISFNAGKWRTEEWGIFNQAGVAVYKAPAHFNVPGLMSDYVTYINKMKEHVGIQSAVAQFIFEKIHPFADGNGRVGRLISSHILAKHGYGFRGLIPFEEYIDERRYDYYISFESSHNITDFIQFFLVAIVQQSKKTLNKLNQRDVAKPEDELPPRQLEILQIIRDHPYCSFDMLHRRFLEVKPSTLRYDVTQLTSSRFIKKIRKTRGATYLATP